MSDPGERSDCAEPRRQSWQWSARMRENELDIAVSTQNSGVEHVRHRAAGVKGKFDDWSGAAAGDAIIAGRINRMEKNRRRPFVQLREYPFESRAPQVVPTVVRDHC